MVGGRLFAPPLNFRKGAKVAFTFTPATVGGNGTIAERYGGGGYSLGTPVSNSQTTISGAPSTPAAPTLSLGGSYDNLPNRQQTLWGGVTGLFDSIGLSVGNAASTPYERYETVYPQTGGGLVDGGANWQDALKGGIAGILGAMGSSGDASGQAQVIPASYQSGGGNNNTLLLIVAAVGVAGAVYYATRK